MSCVAVQKTADFPKLQFLAGRAVHPVVAQWLCLTVQTVQGVLVVDIPVVVQRPREIHMCRGGENSRAPTVALVAFVLRSSSSSR